MSRTSTREGSVAALRAHLDRLHPGPVHDPEQVIAALAPCWAALARDDEGLGAWKLHQAEYLAWQPRS